MNFLHTPTLLVDRECGDFGVKGVIKERRHVDLLLQHPELKESVGNILLGSDGALRHGQNSDLALGGSGEEQIKYVLVFFTCMRGNIFGELLRMLAGPLGGFVVALQIVCGGGVQGLIMDKPRGGIPVKITA